MNALLSLYADHPFDWRFILWLSACKIGMVCLFGYLDNSHRMRLYLSLAIAFVIGALFETCECVFDCYAGVLGDYKMLTLALTNAFDWPAAIVLGSAWFIVKECRLSRIHRRRIARHGGNPFSVIATDNPYQSPSSY